MGGLMALCSLFVYIASVFFATSSYASSGAAVIGSYKNPANARAIMEQVNRKLSLHAEVKQAVVNGTLWHRLLVRGPDASALVTRLRQAGFADTWFLPERAMTPVASSISVQQDSDRSTPVVQQTEAASETQASEPVTPPALAPVHTRFADSQGSQRLIDTIQGIPVHQIVVPNLPDDEVSIILDGIVNEPVWSQVPDYDNMLVAVPGTGEPGHYPTEMRMLATDRGIYVSAVMYQPKDTLVSRLSVRDDFIDRDTFGITLDTSGQGLFAYWFIVALGDSLMDGKVLPERNYQRDWDGPWIGKSASLDDGWSVEMFLPWSMMNLPETDGPRKVGFAVSRQVSHTNERYQWPGHPYASSQFVSALNTMEVLGVEPRQQFSVIPYTSSTIDQARDETEFRVGADLTWKPSPSFEVAASAMPDFGAVEADDVVLNLTAQETFFPEKRLFFLEGNEVFESTPRSNPGNIMRTITNDNFATTSRKVFSLALGPTPISLMNTRRIGGTANQVTVPGGVTVNRGERNLPTDLLGAAKITGALGNLRYGILAAAEDDVEWLGRAADGREVDIEDDGRNFGVARFLYERVGSSRQSLGYIGTLVSGPLYDAEVHGVDAHHTSGSGRVIADVQFIASKVDGLAGQGGLLDLKYSSSARIQHKFELDYFDEDVNFTDLGFLARNDYTAAQYAFIYNNTKGIGFLKDIRGTVILREQRNVSQHRRVGDGGIFWRNSMVLPGRNTVKTGIGWLPERWEDIDSRGNGSYQTEDRWWWDVLLATDASRKLSYSASIGGLQEDLGDWTYNLSAGVTYRPNDNLSLDVDVRYKRRDGWLVYQGGRNFGAYHGPDWQPSIKMNWFLTPQHQLSFTLQWAAVRADERGFFEIPLGDGDLRAASRTLNDHDFTVSLITVQLRYRWEIAPLTDFYVVYNRGNNVGNLIDADFGDLFESALRDPISDNFIIKLRYRFGN